MIPKSKILQIALIALFVLSLLAAGVIFFLYQSEAAQNVKLHAQLVELEARQRQTASQLAESKKTAADLTLQLQEAKNRIDSLTGELTAERSAHSDANNKLTQLNDDLSKQKSLREDLENRLNQLQTDSKQIKEQLRVMQQQKTALEAKIKNLEAGSSGVELGKVVVNPETGKPANGAAAAGNKMVDKKPAAPNAKAAKPVKKEQPAAPVAMSPAAMAAQPLEGKVMIVNKEFNFVVINLGSKDKVNIGDEFSVFHDGKLIGDLKVEKVHEFMSAAGFSADLKDLIKENDKVTLKTK
jgi:hypothetical protein